MKKIFDEIHGYITLNDVETKLVDTSVFQRLRRIKQTSLAYIVYPGAMHSRFSHSLGNIFLANKLAQRLYSEGVITQEEIQYLRLSALLKDLGQFPFSHSIEPIFLNKNISNTYLRDLILSKNQEINEIFDEFSISLKKILDIYHGNSFISAIIDSDVDVDRMDYLVRDSMHTGVQLGSLDLDRLIDTINYGENKTIIILDKGLNSLENFYISRLHMYQSVYYHKTILGYEIQLRDIFFHLADYCCPGIFDESFLKEIISSNYFAYWDDEWIYSKLYESLVDSSVPENLKMKIKNFLDRNGPKVIYEEISFQNQGSRIEENVLKLNKYGIPESAIYPFEEAIKIIDKNRIKVRIKNKEKDLREYSSTLLNVIPSTIYIRRIYVENMYAKKARDILS
ncbi:HD domain-containing protein [Sulfurisphaera javensis]|uniref:HD domain-containing protein n=1 Tax=Sulfurisphaera javensis TaxID=2049879 RepID=A0AAT9GU81_9CREN